MIVSKYNIAPVLTSVHLGGTELTQDRQVPLEKYQSL